MRQLGLFEHQDLKEFTKWDFGCGTSGEGKTSARQNSGCDMFGWNGGRGISGCEIPGEGGTSRGRIPDAGGTSGWNGGEGGFPDMICPGGKLAEGISGCDMSRWNGGGGFPDAICPGGMERGYE